jgi:hypothetical protein
MNAMTDAIKGGFVPDNHYVVIHPIHDKLEEKVDVSKMGPMKMTPGVRLALMSLRAYLVVMVGMVAYRFMDMAGVFETFKG